MITTLQILLNSIVSGLLLSLAAVSFTYIFKVTKVFHLAQGGIYLAGAFAFWWMQTKTGSWLFALLFSFALVSLIIVLIEKTVYLPLNKKHSNQSISLISSIGIYVIIVNIISLIFGNENKVFEKDFSGTFDVGQIILTKVQLIQVVAVSISLFIFWLYLQQTKSSLALQSISDNETISKVFGINTNKERLRVFIIGSLLTALAGILKTIETGIDPQAGMTITLTAAVITILVGRLNIVLIIFFSIVLTLLQNSVEWFLNAQWKEGITFLILLLVILYRTEGIISYNLRKDRA